MGNKTFSLYFKDLTDEAQERLLEFDPNLPQDVINGRMSVWTAELNMEENDRIEHVISVLKETLATELHPNPVPYEIIDDARARLRNGEDISSLALNFKTMEYQFLDHEESDLIKKLDHPNLRSVDTNTGERSDPPLNFGNKDSDNKVIGGDNGKKAYTLHPAIEPKDPNKWD